MYLRVHSGSCAPFALLSNLSLRFFEASVEAFSNGLVQLPEIFKEKSIQEASHRKFTERYGGKVFYIYSFKSGQKKEIYNKDVIDEIRNELTRFGGK